MAEVRVKVCGITNFVDAQLAVDLGAAMLGFNFYPRSPRYIEPLVAAEILAALPGKVESVGVFVNAEIQTIKTVAQLTGIHAAQLHGDETAADCTKVREMTNVKVIKVLRTSPDFHPEDALLYPADMLLMDAHCDQFGGSGRTADWQVVRRIVALTPRTILAGGLTAENIGLAVHTVRPCAVDVASGVESAPGRKDALRMREFFRALAQAQEGEE